MSHTLSSRHVAVEMERDSQRDERYVEQMDKEYSNELINERVPIGRRLVMLGERENGLKTRFSCTVVSVRNGKSGVDSD